MKADKNQGILLLPAGALFIFLLALPLVLAGVESFREFTPGRIGSVGGAPLTLASYAELLHPVYIQYFALTYALSFISSIVAILVAFPIAYYISRRSTPTVRKGVIFITVGLLFLSHLVRIYAIELTFGSTGMFAPLLTALGISMNSREYIYFMIVAGLLQYSIPMSMLILIGTIQNLNPRLLEASQSLGTSAFRSHVNITIPLCVRGIVSVFLVSMTMGISAFAIPWILGRGRVLFVSNLIYSRFNEVANFPSGAAISVIMIILCVVMIYIVSRVATLADRS
ncbi:MULTISPECIES: ABC transporter permease [Mesorhizobium]|uniref:ABC transporter permease n=1 Tax=Mesorhizobium TaxID=68287 RepID=UPI0004794A65|nr:MULTISPECIES: ABC transporter permease subunit [Mesorhizobium]BCG82912.1 putrescine ABC transporter permease [Mesorhizobium sp. 113-3-3]BCG90789.1 putrescine ABC transporter permease [Mesorhizobium sp. 113-3-9]